MHRNHRQVERGKGMNIIIILLSILIVILMGGIIGISAILQDIRQEIVWIRIRTTDIEYEDDEDEQ